MSETKEKVFIFEVRMADGKIHEYRDVQDVLCQHGILTIEMKEGVIYHLASPHWVEACFMPDES